MATTRQQRYVVVRIDNGRDNPHTGIVSEHRSPQTAQRAIDRANARLHRQRGYAWSWHPYAILDMRYGLKVDGTGETL